MRRANKAPAQIFRSSSLQVFLVKGVLNICSKFTGDHSYQSIISIKITLPHGYSPANLLHFLYESWSRNIEQNNFNQYFNKIWNTKVYHRKSKYLIIFFSSIFKLSRLNLLKFYVVFLDSNFITLLSFNSFTFVLEGIS